MRPNSVVRALLAVAAIGAAQSCTVKQNESPDLLGPSSLQSPLGPAAPVARFTVTPDKPTASIAAAFDARSSCPEGGFSGGCIATDRSITTFTWDFGDGSTDSGPTVSHTFRSTGSFNVTLSVQNDRGLTSAASKGVQVDPGTPPKADFVFSPTNPGVGTSVQFNGAQSAAAPGHNIASYSWDFGDGAKGSGITTSHAYGSAGGYNAVLTVTDEVGQTAAAAKSVPVTASSGPGAPTAEFVFSPTDPSVGQSVLFNATQSKAAAGHSIVSYAWNFGDGGTGSGATATHPFGTAGTYTIVLVVTDDLNQTATAAKTVTVKAAGGSPPTASFVFSPASPGTGQSVSFNASQSAATAGHTIVSYAWNFGDGGTATGLTPSHPFATAGTFNVVLIVTDDLGQTGSTTKPVAVTSSNTTPPPNASFVFSPTAPVINQTVSFNAAQSSAATGHSIVSYSWNFGDNTALGSGVTPTHAYGASGTFNVVLTVTDDLGQTGTTSNAITIGSPAPISSFVFSPTAPATNQTVFFNASASSASQGRTIASYSWDFGDGSGPGSGVSPTHAYTSLGTFTVTLVVTDDLGQKGNSSKTVTVSPVVAEFSFSPTDPSVSVTTVNFDGTPSTPSGGIQTYFWDFGDGTTCTNGVGCGGVTGKAQHVFTTVNTFTVRLTVTVSGGQTATVAKTVTVKP